jgi:methyl-accepting chemotaxis protein
MKVSIKSLVLGIVAVLTRVVTGEGVVSITKVDAINENVTNLATNRMPSIYVVNARNTNTSDLRIAEGAQIMSTDPESLGKAEKLRADGEALKKQAERLHLERDNFLTTVRAA